MDFQRLLIFRFFFCQHMSSATSYSSTLKEAILLYGKSIWHINRGSLSVMSLNPIKGFRCFL